MKNLMLMSVLLVYMPNSACSQDLASQICDTSFAEALPRVDAGGLTTMAAMIRQPQHRLCWPRLARLLAYYGGSNEFTLFHSFLTETWEKASLARYRRLLAAVEGMGIIANRTSSQALRELVRVYLYSVVTPTRHQIGKWPAGAFYQRLLYPTQSSLEGTILNTHFRAAAYIGDTSAITTLLSLSENPANSSNGRIVIAGFHALAQRVQNDGIEAVLGGESVAP